MNQRMILSTVIATAIGCNTAAPEAVVSTNTPLTSSQQDDTVQTVAFDPAFVAYAEIAIRLAGKSTHHAAPLDANGQAAATAQATQLDLDIEAGATPALFFPRLTALTTVTTDDFGQLKLAGQALAQRFPNLTTTGPALFGQAIAANPQLQDLVLDTYGRNDDDDELTDCLGDCNDEYISDHNTAIAWFAIDTAICTGLIVFPPVSAACFATAMLDQVRRELDALADYDDCEDICFGNDPDGECEADSDCNSNEWCDTGTLGIGDNVCKPDKSIGQVCSRDAKCLSGCCKFDFWQNPVSMTCNPASDCN